MKKTLAGFILLLALIAIALCSPHRVSAEVDRITKEELNVRLCSPELVLLDVRTGDVWEKSKIKIKCSQRVDPKNVESWMYSIPMDMEIVLYCCS